MIANIFSELASISPMLPLMMRFLVLTIVLMVVWVVISIPAHFFRQAVEPFLMAALFKLTSAVHWLFEIAHSTLKRWVTPLENFITVHAQMFSFADENSQIRFEIARLRSSVEAIPAKIIALEAGIVDAGTNFAAATTKLENIPVPPSVQPPDHHAFFAITKQSNWALISLIMTALISPFLIVFNTVMLTQIIDGWWGGMEFHGYAISTILAVGFTVFEIALGIFVVFAAQPAAKYSLIVLVLMVAFLEANFYARMGKGMHWSILDAWFPEGEAPAWTQQWLGLFGLVIVGGLAFCGHEFVKSLRKVTDNHIVRQWRSFLRQRTNIANEMAERLSTVERTRGVIVKSLDDVRTAFSATSGIAESNLSVIEAAKDAFLAEIDKASKIRLEDKRRLDRGAMIRMLLESLALIFGTVLAFVLTAYLYRVLSASDAGLWLTGWQLGLTVAVGKGGLLLLIGNLASRSSAILPATDGLPATAVYSGARLLIAYAVLAVAIGGDAFYSLRGLTSAGALVFVLLAIANVFLLFVGTKLGLMGAAFVSCAHSLGLLACAGILALGGIAVWLVYLAVVLVRLMLVVLSMPFRAILFRRTRPEPDTIGAAA